VPQGLEGAGTGTGTGSGAGTGTGTTGVQGLPGVVVGARVVGAGVVVTVVGM